MIVRRCNDNCCDQIGSRRWFDLFSELLDAEEYRTTPKNVVVVVLIVFWGVHKNVPIVIFAIFGKSIVLGLAICDIWPFSVSSNSFIIICRYFAGENAVLYVSYANRDRVDQDHKRFVPGWSAQKVAIRSVTWNRCIFLQSWAVHRLLYLPSLFLS